MIAVGFISYYYAQDGLSEKFKESSVQTSNMAIQYLDTSCTYIQSEGMRYAFDSGVESYSLGMPGKSASEKTNYMSDTRILLLASRKANPFIGNVHIIPKAGNQIITSLNAEHYDGIYDDYYNEILENMDFGKGSITGFVTDSGKEITSEGATDMAAEIRRNGEGVFSQQNFYAQSLVSEDLSGVMDVTYPGKKYLYVYSRSEVCSVTLCSLIPLSIVTGQAEKIKNITITLVILAAIIAICIGTLITMGIRKNMKSISHKLNEAAKGDLTVSVKVQGKDEFRSLAQTATNMIKNNKNLVLKLTDTVSQLEKSAEDVSEASGDITECSSDIVRAIGEISQGMSKQAEHARECVIKTGGLSGRGFAIVAEVINVFRNMDEQITRLYANMKEIADSTEIADKERNDTMEAVENISSIIDRTAGNTEHVHDMAVRLQGSVQKLDHTAQTFDDNMTGLKREISAFKVEKL